MSWEITSALSEAPGATPGATVLRLQQTCTYGD